MNDFRKTLVWALPAAALAIAAGSALATDNRAGSAGPASGHAAAAIQPAPGMQDLRISDVIGKQVVDAQGRSMGEVKDLLIDIDARRIAYALVSGGEAFDPPGDRLVQLPVGEVATTLRGGRFQVDLDADRLAGYPTIDPRAWDDRFRSSAASGVPQPLRRASAVLDAGLLDGTGRRVGEVEDVVVDASDGSLRYGVAEFDPSWMERGKLVALPIDAVQVARDGGEDLVLRIDRADLARAPAFSRDRWPDLGDAGFVQRVKGFFSAA